MKIRRGTLGWMALFLLLLAGIIVPFLIWGEAFDAFLSPDGAKTWIHSYGSWGWAVGMGLLIGDVVLPIPGTVVMSALGWLYGWFLGGLAAGSGSFLSGLTAYSFCRWLGRPAARWFAGEEGLQRGEALFERSGGWLVVLSRWMPILPEAVSCLAGLTKMRWRTFLIALACGSFPMGFVFAAVGHLGQERPGLALGLSALIPVLLWLVAAKILRRSNS